MGCPGATAEAMVTQPYDIISIGGGLAGSALAKAMAENGARVLVLERERAFRDRVRGEAIMSWGVAEARELGIYDTIVSAGGHELSFWDSYQGSDRTGHRNLLTTTAPKTPVLAFYHPAMQEALIGAAAAAGAEVRRGAAVRGLDTSGTPTVTAVIDGRDVEFQGRMLVGADGRTSLVRRWGSFDVRQDPDQNLVAGLLLEGVSASDDATHSWLNPAYGQYVLLFPQGNGRARAYVCYPAAWGYRLNGAASIPRFMEDSAKAGVPEDCYKEAKAAGPLATFSGGATWVQHPYRNGVALIGDAASTADPTWGQGLSIAIRDARILRDRLLHHDNWDEAGNAYAKERGQYYAVVHTVESWQTEILMETGPEADARREKVLPLWREDRTRHPDTFLSGPGPTLDDQARRRFFGEE